MSLRSILFALFIFAISVPISAFAQETPTPEPTATEAPTLTPVPTWTLEPSWTPPSPPTPLPTATLGEGSPLPTDPPTLTLAPSLTPTTDATFTETPTLTETATANGTASMTPSATMTETATASATASLTPSATGSPSAQVEPFYFETFGANRIVPDLLSDRPLRELMRGNAYTLVPSGNDMAMQVTEAELPVFVTTLSAFDVDFSLDVSLLSGDLRIQVRKSEFANYELRFKSTGSLELYRADVPVASGSLSGYTPGQQVRLSVNAIGNQLTVAVNGQMQLSWVDPMPLELGMVMFYSTGLDPMYPVILDNILFQRSMRRNLETQPSDSPNAAFVPMQAANPPLSYPMPLNSYIAFTGQVASTERLLAISPAFSTVREVVANGLTPEGRSVRVYIDNLLTQSGDLHAFECRLTNPLEATRLLCLRNALTGQITTYNLEIGGISWQSATCAFSIDHNYFVYLANSTSGSQNAQIRMLNLQTGQNAMVFDTGAQVTDVPFINWGLDGNLYFTWEFLQGGRGNNPLTGIWKIDGDAVRAGVTSIVPQQLTSVLEDPSSPVATRFDYPTYTHAMPSVDEQGNVAYVMDWASSISSGQRIYMYTPSQSDPGSGTYTLIEQDVYGAISDLEWMPGTPQQDLVFSDLFDGVNYFYTLEVDRPNAGTPQIIIGSDYRPNGQLTFFLGQFEAFTFVTQSPVNATATAQAQTATAQAAIWMTQTAQAQASPTVSPCQVGSQPLGPIFLLEGGISAHENIIAPGTGHTVGMHVLTTPDAVFFRAFNVLERSSAFWDLGFADRNIVEALNLWVTLPPLSSIKSPGQGYPPFYMPTFTRRNGAVIVAGREFRYFDTTGYGFTFDAQTGNIVELQSKATMIIGRCAIGTRLSNPLVIVTAYPYR